MTTARLDDEHVRRFATASGDVNPLHVDAEFARRTMYGRCVAHGVLVAIVALGAVEPATLSRTRVASSRAGDHGSVVTRSAIHPDHRRGG
jgi:acyl dehydratase